MSSYDEAREAAARELHRMMPGVFDSFERDQEMWTSIASATLDAFLAKLSETHAVVPRVATDEMMQASRNVSPSGEWREVIQRAWAAMLTTAPAPASQPDTPAK